MPETAQVASLDNGVAAPAPPTNMDEIEGMPVPAGAALNANGALAKGTNEGRFFDKAKDAESAPATVPARVGGGLGGLGKPVTAMTARGGAMAAEGKLGAFKGPQVNFGTNMKADLLDQFREQPQEQVKDLARKEAFFAAARPDADAKPRIMDGLKREALAEDFDRDAVVDQAKKGAALRFRAETRRALGELQQQRQLAVFARGDAGFIRQPAVMMTVREYSHEHPASANPELRSDFAETLCWRPALVLANGKAEVAFDLSDAATTFQALAFAHTLDGRLGAGVQVIESQLPFALQPAVPIEVTSSDTINVPLSVANNTSAGRDVKVTLRSHGNLQLLDGKGDATFAVDGGKTARPLYSFQPTIKEGEATLEFTGTTEPFAYDGVQAKFHVAPEGFPVAESHSDVLEGSASQTVTLPETWVKDLHSNVGYRFIPRRWPICKKDLIPCCASRTAASSRLRRAIILICSFSTT